MVATAGMAVWFVMLCTVPFVALELWFYVKATARMKGEATAPVDSE